MLPAPSLFPLTCRITAGRINRLLVRVEFWLGCNRRSEFLGCLLLGDGDACTAQRWSRLHSGWDLSYLVVTVLWVPHGSVGKNKKKKKKTVSSLLSIVAIFIFGIFWNLINIMSEGKKSIPLNNWPFTLCFSWNLWNRKGNSMRNVMKNKLVLNKNKWELPHSIRGKKISPINTAIKVANPRWVKYKQTA